MRMRIELDDRLVAEVDQLAGPRGRSGFVRSAIEQAVRQERGRQDVEAAAGAIADTGHSWDEDPAAWVRQQRQVDALARRNLKSRAPLTLRKWSVRGRDTPRHAEHGRPTDQFPEEGRAKG